MQQSTAKQKVEPMEPIEQNPTNGEPPPERKRKGRPKGSKNKPKSVDESKPAPTGDGIPSPDFNGTDRAAGEVSTKDDRWNQIIQQAILENNSKNERGRFLEANNKGITELHDFVVERNFLAQAQPLVDQINFGFDAVDEMGRALLHNVRATGVLLHKWKDEVGHGNWVEAYESSGFHKSIDTARNWMRLSLMDDKDIAEVGSVREALALLKDEKERKKGKGGNPNPGLDDDGDGDGDPKPEGPKPEGEGNPRPESESKPEPETESESESEREFELTLIDELEMVMKRVCAEHPREEVARMVASMLNDYYQPK